MRSILERHRIRYIVGQALRNRKFQTWRRFRGARYLNLGCGGNTHPHMINMDYLWRPGIDLCWDVKKGIPLPDSSVKGVVTEHVLEHFTWKEAIKLFLPECYRVLTKGGTIRISVPEGEEAVDRYIKARESGKTAIPFRGSFDGPEGIPMTPMMHLNNTFHRLFEPLPVGHKFAYDFHTLEAFLYSVGFRDIKRETFGHGRDLVLLIDREIRKPESLYVEASKH